MYAWTSNMLDSFGIILMPSGLFCRRSTISLRILVSILQSIYLKRRHRDLPFVKRLITAGLRFSISKTASEVDKKQRKERPRTINFESFFPKINGNMNIDEGVMQQTMDLLSQVIQKPPLNFKLLSRPPFRFLHDIISEVISNTGQFADVFTPEEMDSGNVKVGI